MNNAGAADKQEGQNDNKPLTRRRFMGCAAVAGGTAALGYAGASLGIEASLKYSNETTQAAENNEALKRLLLRSQEGPSGRRFPVLVPYEKFSINKNKVRYVVHALAC